MFHGVDRIFPAYGVSIGPTVQPFWIVWATYGHLLTIREIAGLMPGARVWENLDPFDAGIRSRLLPISQVK
jgi:hypothetical protein